MTKAKTDVGALTTTEAGEAIKTGGDAGNNALKLWFEEKDPVIVPSTYALHIGDTTEQFEEADITSDEILNNLDVTIMSKALKQSNARYLVGNIVLENQIKGTELEKLSDKSTDELPVVVLLSALAGEAIKRNPNKNQIEIAFDLSVALPVVTITQKSAEAHSKRLIGTHQVIFHHPSGRDVTVLVNIEFCKCLPEGAAAAWGVVYDEHGNLTPRPVEINDELVKIDFENKRLLHFDIGAGSTEVVVTDGVQYRRKLSEGLNYGTKETINEIIKRWNKENQRKSINGISAFNEIYFNTEHPRHVALVMMSKTPLKNLALTLSEIIINKIDDLKDDPYTFIYGGGSIILKGYLEEILREKGRLTNVIFLSDPMYVNARGLLVFTCSPLYAAAKESYLSLLANPAE